MTAKTLEGIAALLEQRCPTPERLALAFGSQRLEIRSNSAPLLEELTSYFAAFAGAASGGGTAGGRAAEDPCRPADLVVRVHAMKPLELGLPYREWSREPGKQAQKEAFCDLPDGRAVLKVRTGMQFLVGPTLRVAFGDALAQPNQVVNFIDFQYTAHLMNQGLALCHAAGVARGGRGLGLAGLAGGGKSTLALHLMSRGWSFCSNDRLLVGPSADGPVMRGIPKHPRINPGTALSIPALSTLVSHERQAELARLSRDALWSLEEKYDAEIDRFFGPGRVLLDAPIEAFLILAWSRHTTGRARFEPVDLANRPDLLGAVMKSPGPFLLPTRGPWPQGFEPPDPDLYLDRLKGIPVFEASGGVDFARAVEFAEALLGASPTGRGPALHGPNP